MKKFLIIILAFIPQILWCADGDVFSANTTEGVEMTFKVTSETSKTCQVGDSNGQAISQSYKGALTIPEQVNGYSVTSIGSNAFYNCQGLTSVNLSSARVIGQNAFRNCTGLTSVNFCSEVYIDIRAFRGCTSLTSVNIESCVIHQEAFSGCTGLTSVKLGECAISYYAFRDCVNLTNFEISGYVNDIYSYAFENCKSLKELYIPEGLRFIHDFAFSGCRSLNNITLPNSVTYIGIGAFYECNSLETISIPNAVTSIAEYTFYNCSSLKSVEVPNSVSSIGESAFYGCSSLESINIPNAVTSIAAKTFYDCSSLKSVDVPNSVTSIGESAFDGCSSLESINIPNAVTSIDASTFRYCRNLTSVDIPNSVTSIGAYAFAGCYSLPSITIPNSVTMLGKNAFGGCISFTSMAIPSSVTTISDQVFYNCRSMESIDIPNSVTSIGNHAFSLCRSLKSVNIPNSVKSIGISAFSECDKLVYINFPNSITSVGDGVLEECPDLAAIIWDADMPMTNEMLVTASNPNLLFYTKDKSYVPSDIKNIIENGIAKEITLSEADSCNNFYCPQEFTAEKVSYTHRFGMESGYGGKAQGWESIALPFTVSEITHESKGKLLPFGSWNGNSSEKPFWLCSLSSSGFTRATSIEANTPYIICMPNNANEYDEVYCISGNVTFSATNAKVLASNSVNESKSNSKTFIPAFCAQDKSSTVYALNVNNSFHSELGSYTEGSAFVSGLRKVSPFEAYMTTSDSNAKRAFLIDFSETTGIDEVPTTDMKDGTHKIYNLNGQLVKQTNSQQELDETLKQLPAGVYVVNGKKTIIK